MCQLREKQDQTLKQYIDALNRIAKAAERRVELLERQPDMFDLTEQASIRARQMSDAVRKLEGAAMGEILRLVTPSAWSGAPVRINDA